MARHTVGAKCKYVLGNCASSNNKSSCLNYNDTSDWNVYIAEFCYFSTIPTITTSGRGLVILTLIF